MNTKEAIEHFGGIKNLAEALDCWSNEIYRWGEYPPKGKRWEIQGITNGKLKAYPEKKAETE